MRARLKEDPKEWRNFTLLCCGFVTILAAVGYWQKAVSGTGLGLVVAGAVVIAGMAFAAPRLFRWWYRAAMTVSFRIGQVMGKVILGVFYLLVLTPLGLALRLGGKDLLETRRGPEQESYWKPARKRGKLDQQF